MSLAGPFDFPIVDAHLHLWDPRKLRYPWLDQVPQLNRSFLLHDYAQACGSVAVDKMVFVQCECDPAVFREETAWVSSLALKDPRIAGIVSWAPLERGDRAEPDLLTLAANSLVKGIRRIIQFEADPSFCLQPDFIRGVQLLAKFGLSFDLCLKGEAQTESALKLVRRCPEVSFMLDHIGKPFIREHRTAPWSKHLAEFAGFPHVWCKLSGLVVEADVGTWQPDDLRPYVEAVMTTFGPNRVVFGGDWPVVLSAATFERWVETIAHLLSTLSPTEKRSVFRSNAEIFYRLSA